MPASPAAGDPDHGAKSGSGLWQRLLLAMPRLRRDDDAPLGERLRDAMLKPADPSAKGAATRPGVPDAPEELEEAVRHADDRERLIGLMAAPLAAVIALLVGGSLISQATPARLGNGKVNPHHASLAADQGLLLVLLVLCLAMLAAAWFRKRLLIGAVMGLYGLGLFNLRFWGFGAPFILAGGWYLVRAYRLQRALRDASGGPGGPGVSRPRPNKRYTPPR